MSQQDLIPISFQISDIDVFPGLSKIPSAVSLKKRATESAPPPSTSNVNTGDNENEDEGQQRLEIQESILKWKFNMTNLQGSAKRLRPGLVNVVPAVAYHFCLSLPAAFTQPGLSL